MITTLSKKKGKEKEKGEKGKGKEGKRKEKGKEKDGFWLTQEKMQNLFWEKNHIFSQGGKNFLSYIFPKW